MHIKHLSNSDALLVLELINDSLTCTSPEHVLRLMCKLRALLPYQAALSCMGKIGTNGEIGDVQVVNMDYPAEYLAELAKRELTMKDPIVSENFKNFGMQYWADTLKKQPLTHDAHTILSLAEDYGFHKGVSGCGYGHGVRNFKGTQGSFFCYSGLDRSSRSEEILSLIIPHFHEVLRRMGNISKNNAPLTAKEIDVLTWLTQGKSTWDISVILKISERTVKFHIGNILRKLDATTRTHAVAIAFEQGLVEID